MTLFKLTSRYIIVSLIVLIIYYFKLQFFDVIFFELIFYLLLCSYLDFYAPIYNSIKYHENNLKKNTLTIDIIINVLINYCTYIQFLFITINIIKPYELTLFNIILNYLYSVPLSLLSSFLFYYSHKFLHTPFMYRLFHKQHHSHNNPSSFVALYSSIPDFIISNCVSIFIPYFILQVHPLFIISYSFIAILDIFTHHTSYYFTNNILENIIGGSKFHHVHHYKMKYNYGLNNELFDKLHNTLFN